MALVAPLAAQGSYAYTSCAQGPGAAFGVEGYQCANCGFKTQSGAPTTYTFFAEPVVTQASSGSRLAGGDVIVAVDGQPITTQAGADRFAYPASGEHVLTIRRGRDRQDLRVDIQPACVMGAAGVSGGRGFGGRVGGAAVSGAVSRGGSGFGGAVGGGTGVAPSLGACEGQVRLRGNVGAVSAGAQPEPVIIVDGVVQPARQKEEGGRFGFAVNSRPVCRVERSDDKVTRRLVFEDYPMIYAVRPGSAADKAALRAGDVILSVEGKSVLDDAVLLTGADLRNDLHMTVRRDGKELSVVMLVTP